MKEGEMIKSPVLDKHNILQSNHKTLEQALEAITDPIILLTQDNREILINRIYEAEKSGTIIKLDAPEEEYSDLHQGDKIHFEEKNVLDVIDPACVDKKG